MDWERPRKYRPRFVVDFNDPEPFDVLVPGDKVFLSDGEGNSCEGTFEQYGPGRDKSYCTIRFKPDYSTWKDAPE